MKELIAAAAELQAFLQKEKWEFCFIGGLALQRWGYPRLTRDMDVTLMVDFGGESPVIGKILSAYRPRVAGAAQFALDNRVLLVKTGDGIGIDIAFGALPFEHGLIRRASGFEYLPGVPLRTCSAEDLIILKAFAERPQDWIDVEAIARRQENRLDKKYILDNLGPLAALKESPQIIEKLTAILSPRRGNEGTPRQRRKLSG